MPEEYRNLVNLVLRDHQGFTGDGRGGVGDLPIGDRSTARKPIEKRDLRAVLLASGNAADTAIEAAKDAEDWAQVALSVAGSSVIYTTRDALAQGVQDGEYPDGTICYVQARRYLVDPIGPDRLVAIDMDWHGQLGALVSRMARGGLVRIAAYGDSTTDGTGTTDWTANPTDSNGNATGTAAHTPANAWPAICQQALRAMHANSSISIWNAGYAGKFLVTGWARNNLRAAIIDNPAYGTPEILLLNFGVNDIVHADYTPQVYAQQLRYVLSQCDYFGIVPVIVTPDPVSALNSGRQAGNIAQLVEVLRSVADQCGVTVIDSYSAMSDVMSAAGSQSRWAALQPDGTHGGDAWHSVKGGFIAASLFPNTLWMDDQDVTDIPSWSRYANTHRLSYDLSGQATPINNAPGASLNVQAGSYTSEQRTVDLWLWSKAPDAVVWWMSVDGEGYYSPRELASAPKLVNYSYLNRSANSRVSPTAGQAQGAAGRRAAETPCLVGQLFPGLSRMSVLAPADSNESPVFLGYFSIRKRANFGSFAQVVPASGTGTVVYDPDPHNATALIGGYGMGRMMDMAFSAALPPGSGAVLLAERVFGGTTAISANNRRGLVIFRTGSDEVALYQAIYGSTGAATVVGPALDAQPYTWTDSNLFRIKCEMTSAGQQQIRLFAGWQTNSPLSVVTVSRGSEMLPLGGRPGPIFKNFDISGGGVAVLDIKDLTVI